MDGHVNSFVVQMGDKAKGNLIRDPRGLLVSEKQSYFISNGLNQNLKTIQSLTTPKFGSQFEIDVKEVGYLENLDLNFIVSAINEVYGGIFLLLIIRYE